MPDIDEAKKHLENLDGRLMGAKLANDNLQSLDVINALGIGNLTPESFKGYHQPRKQIEAMATFQKVRKKAPQLTCTVYPEGEFTRQYSGIINSILDNQGKTIEEWP